MVYKRKQFKLLTSRLLEKRRFIQVLAGPRQSGKTTVAMQVADALDIPVRFVSADDPEALGRVWLEQQWDISRTEAKAAGKEGSVLIIDEIQKVPAWSETAKRLWDEDTAKRIPLRVLILGSAPLLIHQGLTESLAGRFEIIRSTHWSYGEMRDAFEWSLDQYLYFGGYPGAADLITDETRWKRYILDSMVEATLSRDILQMKRIDKPALLRQLFNVACAYSGQILSYTKIVGQLQDAGNTTTLAHYLELLGAAGMTVGLHKYAGQKVRQRGSSPKFQVLNGAFMTCQSELSFAQAKGDHAFWGRLVESAVGAHLVNESYSEGLGVFYWREGEKEVDFVVKRGSSLTAIEVKSVPGQSALSGMKEFASRFNPKGKLLVGGDGIRVEEFLGKPLTNWVK
jgi:predicted AAA+ superfamily ATPase